MLDYHTKFYQNYQSCPKCKNTLEKEENVAFCSNKDCGFSEYNNPAPAVCAVIVKDNKTLLALRAHAPRKGKWDEVGGFINAGETIEATITREVKEETGLDVIGTTYLGSIPDSYDGRPSLNFAYLVKVAPGTPVPNDDVSDLKWFNLNSIPTREELAFKNTWESIQFYKKYLRNKKRK